MIRQILPAVLLPLVVTGFTSAGAAWNRSAGREPIVLSDRELSLRYASADNSGRSVWIRHQYTWGENVGWFDAAKLAALGFDTSVDPASPDAEAHYRRALRRVAYIALELDGPAWQAWAADYERNMPRWTREGDVEKQLAAGSRLVPVDAALDAAALEARYPNARTHLITRGIVRLVLFRPPAQGRPRLSGAVEELAPDTLYVPVEIAGRLDTTPYRLRVRYGRRYEPWIVGVEP